MALFDEYLARFFRRETFLESVTYLPQHVLLWALLVSEIRYIRKHSFGKSCRHTKDLLLLFAKSVLNLVVLVLAISNFGRPATPLATRIIEALSYIITLTLLHLGEHYNVRDQTFLLCFWTLDLLINSIRMVEQSSIESMVFGGIMLTLVLLIAYSSVISSCHSNSTVPPNLIRSVNFSWFNDINRAIHRSKSSDELGTLNDDMQAATLMRSFRGVTVSRGQYESVAIGEEASPTLISIRSMLRPFLRDLIITGVNRLVLTVLFFVCPFLLGQILRQDRSTELETHSQVISIFIVSLLIAALNGQYLYDAQKIGLKIKSVLMTMVYEKSLKLTSSNPADVTLLTLDSSRFIDLLPNVHMIWSGPLIIVASIVGLVIVLGWWSALVGVLVMVVTIFATKHITDKLRVLQKDFMDRKDPRISTTNEALGMIKQIKLYCWETFFQDRIQAYRQRELQSLRKIINWDIPKYLLGVISPFVVSLASFGMMILIGDASLLTLESVFVSIALFNILKYPLSVLPSLSSTWTAVQASVDRINTFLGAAEIPTLPRPKSSSGGTRSRQLSDSLDEVLGECRKTLHRPVVSIKRASFTIAGKPILHSIDLQIYEGSFLAITGPVGSGKSSLLTAILGEFDHSGEMASVVGHSAYVSQEPWILHQSIRQNILFGQEWDQLRYKEAIEACELLPDLSSFPEGDATVVGEKGVTVSGGQKQRIVLARAVYQSAEMYLFDDPLSSVDGEVSGEIYRKVFGRGGLLFGKTVVLVTQDVELMKDADTIVLMEGGRILEKHSYGSYREKYCTEDSLYGKSEEEPKSDNQKFDEQLFVKRTSETIKEGRIARKIYYKYLEKFGWISVLLIVLINILIPLCDIYSTIWLAEWSTTNHNSALKDHYYLAIYSLFVLGLAIFLTLNSAATTVRGAAVSKQVHNKLLQSTLHKAMNYFDSTNSGQIMNRFSTDLDVVDSKISLNFRDLLTNLSSVISILILFCFNTSYYIIIVLVVIMLFYYWLLSYHLETSRQLKRFAASSNAPIILHFNESREGRTTIRAYRQEDRFREQFMMFVDQHQHYSYLYQASSRWLGIRLEIIGAITIYFVTMFAIHNEATIGASNVGVNISYGLRLIPLLNALVRSTALLEENATSLERIDQSLNDQSELEVCEVGSDQKGWPSEGKIEFVNFSMDYGSRAHALLGINLEISAREKLGIVGRTGAGKSSLISSLFRLYPSQTKGTIKIDGVDIDRVPLKQLRQSLTIIPQNPTLFLGTLRQNLDPTNNHTNDVDLWRVLDLCKLKELVTNFPEQLDTMVDDRRSNLSVGQKQLLCLARGILRNTRIVILDEATSAMDGETERTIQQVFRETFEECTVLMIAHRKSTIREVDRVLYMRQGKIVKLDRPSEFGEGDLMEL
ncbi:hypothetical protein pipiens_009961 [Culex pipiens pipiens]|uniref:Uncharacterized protein n=1 Tax=Culex pipiens pipiens TaxID=38569 RepID=A0ABD1DC20_CULPP